MIEWPCTEFTLVSRFHSWFGCASPGMEYTDQGEFRTWPLNHYVTNITGSALGFNYLNQQWIQDHFYVPDSYISMGMKIFSAKIWMQPFGVIHSEWGLCMNVIASNVADWHMIVNQELWVIRSASEYCYYEEHR